VSYDKPVNYCSACGEDFGSVGTFDKHRVGVHDYTLTEGLRMDPPREDGRRCLAIWEMEAKGWHLDRRMLWRQPMSEKDRVRVGQIRSRPARGSDG
jgi:hypothetical protein